MRGRPTVTTRRRRRAALALAAVVTATACGGTKEVTLPGPEAPTPPLTRAEYTARANDVCRATTREIAAKTDEIGSASFGGDSGDRQKLHDAVDPIVRQALVRLDNLTPPPADAAIARQAIDALAAAADTAARDPQAPLDPVGLIRPDLFDYGLTGCFTNG
jgi:hypothetical protein